MTKTITLALTGASGMPYAMRLLESLLAAGHRFYLLYSKAAQFVAAQEMVINLPAKTFETHRILVERTGCKPEQLQVFAREDWNAPIASGTGAADAMVVCPCTMGALAAIANGLSDNLIERAADVMLKEGRKLILVPRETPFSAIHLENMLRLSHLVADLLFTTRVSSGSPLVDPYRADLAVLLCEAVDAASLAADSRGVRITSRVPDELPAVVDGMRLRQVFDNLLDNAVDYSTEGGVVAVDLAVRDEHVVLTVTDEGTGIDESEVEQVFNRFYRGANARRLQVPGTGLGLTIVRSIVEAHGGVVSLESTLGEGTSVCVMLPR